MAELVLWLGNFLRVCPKVQHPLSNILITSRLKGLLGIFVQHGKEGSGQATQNTWMGTRGNVKKEGKIFKKIKETQTEFYLGSALRKSY